MAYDKTQSRVPRRAMLAGDKQMTAELSASVTVQVIQLTMVAQKVTWQSTGTLAGNVEFSSNGTDFYTSTAFTANVVGSYNTHNVVAVRVTRTGGTGKLAVLAV